ncbi:MAG: sulfite exporter TauE/SafE family protein, partial [Mailhella sp.]|nr:sulfite exporter TauE/SafE family protein [Mailhella sp.]
GVRSVTASFEKGQAEVVYDPQTVTVEDLRKQIRQAGYEPREEGSFGKTAAVLIILLALYVAAKHFGWTKIFDFFPAVETTVSLGMLFVIGLLTSVHCIAMCGGINLTQSVISSEKRGNPLRSNLLYNSGRIISYTLTGALCGGIGRTLSLSGTLRGIIPLIAGVVMIIMALRMLGIFGFLRKIRFNGFPRFLLKIRPDIGKNTGRSSFVTGLANGLMPCGPLQSMQIYALGTGSAWAGACSMACFCLGTIPALLALGMAAGRLSAGKAGLLFRCAAVVVMILGCSMLGNGLALTGITAGPQLTASPAGERAPGARAVVRDGRQEVVSQADFGSYEPIIVQKGLPVAWTLVMPEGRLIGCNNEIVVPEFGIRKKLAEGKNTMTFTPGKSGVFPFSCWMGMIRSSIRVVDAL